MTRADRLLGRPVPDQPNELAELRLERGGYGPRVRAGCALPSEAYRVGKRGAARPYGDFFGVPIRPAAVCGLRRKTAAALESVVAAADRDGPPPGGAGFFASVG